MNSSDAKRLDVVASEARFMIQASGYNHAGFLTLTYAELLDYAEVQRRWCSLRTNLMGRYRPSIIGLHLSPGGRFHYHGIVTCKQAIRDDETDVPGLMEGDYRSANSALREQWAFLREACPRYGFGRHQLMPLKKTAEHAATYLAGELCRDDPRLKGKRRIRFIGFKGKRKATMQRAWVGGPGSKWRDSVQEFCKFYNIRGYDDMKQKFGRRWAWKLKDFIYEFTLEGGAQ